MSDIQNAAVVGRKHEVLGEEICAFIVRKAGSNLVDRDVKGELAVKQSKALIRTFKQMKDYIIENQGLIGKREFLKLSMQTH